MSVAVRRTTDGFIEVRGVKLQWGVDAGSTLRFEAASAGEIAGQMTRVHSAETPFRSEVAVGGSEMTPVLNLINRRSDGDESAVALEWTAVAGVVAQIRGLSESGSGAPG